jgi:hypothetical protein
VLLLTLALALLCLPVFSPILWHLQTGQTYVDQLDLLREQVRLLADEIKLRDSTIKRLSEQAEEDPAQEAQINVRACSGKLPLDDSE